MKKFKSGDFVERIEPNKDGTHNVEMVNSVRDKFGIYFEFLECFILGNIEVYVSKPMAEYRPISPKKVKFNLKNK